MKELQQASSTVPKRKVWQDLYLVIKGYAIAKNYSNTIIALSIAIKYHNGQTRKDGTPYIIHPLTIAMFLINLRVDDDITLAAAILHDVIEDNHFEDNGEHLVTEFGLDQDVLKIVRLLSKDPNYKVTDPTEEKYYHGIATDIRAIMIKIADRTDNVSTIDVFTPEKMKSYVSETKTLVYPLFKQKELHPKYSNAITITKYLIVSLCEVTESILGIKTPNIDPQKYKKTFAFIKGYARGKNMPNTSRALYVAEKLHEGQTRSSGDPFIIHPLRVCSYLISLRITDDVTCAAAILHEVFKKCDIQRDSDILEKEYHIDPEVVKLIKIVSKPDDMDKATYYDILKKDPRALLTKLSNRANTCTILTSYTQEEIDEYVAESKEYIYPLCSYGLFNYPEYSESIDIMNYHIYSICRLVSSLTHLKPELKTS